MPGPGPRLTAEPPRWVPAYIALGANLGKPAATVLSACKALGDVESTRLVLRSACYQSPPMGPPDQPDFVNAVAAVITRLEPDALLAELQRIETAFGRDRSGPAWGPRTLDLDLLVYGTRCINSDTLTVPHPGLHLRNFVLYPLREIAPDLSIPGLGLVRDLAAAVSGSGLRVLEQGI